MAHRTIEKLSKERERLLSLVEELSEEAFDQQHGEGWTIREILTHVLNAEEDHCKVLTLIARGDHDRLPSDFSLDEHNVSRVQGRGHLSKAELLDALRQQRARTESLFEKLDEEQLERAGRHPALGEITVGKIFRIIGLHDRLHAQDIAAALDRAG